MSEPVQNQLYDLFGHLYRIIGQQAEVKTMVESALDTTVRELVQQSLTRRSETITEMKGVEKLLGDFNPEISPAVAGIVHHFGVMPSRPELFSIAECIKQIGPANIGPLTRMHKRRKLALLKWYDQNWDVIATLLPQINFE
jgi:hypothetical protein